MSSSAPFELPKMEIPGLDIEDVGSLLNTGTYAYYRLMRQQIQNNLCSFCQVDPKVNEKLYENDRWMIWKNPVGKKNTALALHLVIPTKGQHVTDPLTMNCDYGSALINIWQWAISEFPMPHGGALIMRFGKVKHNAGSMRHLHANIKVPTGKLIYPEESHERLLHPNMNTTIHRNDHWSIWENRVLRGEPSIEKRFILSLHGEFITSPLGLNPESGDDLIDLLKWSIRELELPGGALIVRFGEDRPLYANIVVPKGTVRHEESLAEGLKETLAKDADDQARKMPIMLALEKMFQAEEAGNPKPFDILTPGEQELVKDRL